MPKKGSDRGMELPEGSYLMVEDPKGDLMRVQLPGKEAWLAVEVPGLSLLISCPWITCVQEVPLPPIRKPKADIVPTPTTPTPKKAPVAPAIDMTFPEPWAFDPKEGTYWQESSGYLFVAIKEGKRKGSNLFIESKLDQTKVDEIRAIGTSMLQKDIAKMYGVSGQYIGQILNGRKRKA